MFTALSSETQDPVFYTEIEYEGFIDNFSILKYKSLFETRDSNVGIRGKL